ncbi:MAG: GntR family transcriptional regulator [Nocardioidaceae bacterium]
MTTSVDRKSPLPLYVQLERALRERIRTQGLKPGDRLPSEAEIEEQYAVSRATIRMSLNRMVADGQVERVQGLGSFVAQPRPMHQSLLNSFTENMKSQGFRPHRRLLRSETVEPEDDVRAALELREGQCQYLERLLIADDRPIALARTWMPVDCLAGRLDLFSAHSLGSSSLYELLHGPDIGLVLDCGVETVRAALADESEASLLEYPSGSPTLIVRRTSFISSGRPVEWSVMTFAADRYEYHVELTRPAP